MHVWITDVNLSALCISESCIEIKVNLNFIFTLLCDAFKVARVVNIKLGFKN